MTECNFMIKNLSCNFGCILLERSLIKSVILLAYILYCLKKYTSKRCVYFVVLGGMIVKSTYFPPVVLVHPYVHTRSHKVLVNLSTNVDSKLTEKGFQVFFRHPPTHTLLLPVFTVFLHVTCVQHLIKLAGALSSERNSHSARGVTAMWGQGKENTVLVASLHGVCEISLWRHS